MTDDLELPLLPWANPAPQPKWVPTLLRVVPMGARLGIGVCLPGRSDLTGGLCDPAAARAFARELLRQTAELLGPERTAEVDGRGVVRSVAPDGE